MNSYDKIKIKLKTVKLLKNTNDRYSKFLHGKEKHSKDNKAQIKKKKNGLYDEKVYPH